jgi:broad specificity phosphatase PhoE
VGPPQGWLERAQRISESPAAALIIALLFAVVVTYGLSSELKRQQETTRELFQALQASHLKHLELAERLGRCASAP